ncbi:hypothetical protein [Tabrizicola aquatica]|uniref:hypothetical protein n=1 Tax=Tabrizicola aquatica TaxID=909926 RepID=UPI000CD1E4C5|nr:hypothetical protein [Tabrizicola aquatica]
MPANADARPYAPPDAVTIEVAGRLLGLSAERIRQLIRGGHAVGAGRGRVRLVSLLRGYSAFLRAEITKPESAAMGRTHQAKAALVSSATERRRAELMPRVDAEVALCTLREIAARHLRGFTTGRALKGLPTAIQEAVKREVAKGIEQVEEAEREARQALLTGDLDRLGLGGQR